MTTLLRKLVMAALCCFIATDVEAAGIRLIDMQADHGGPALTGAIWSPCATPPQEVEIGGIALPGVKDCPIAGDKLPWSSSHTAGAAHLSAIMTQLKRLPMPASLSLLSVILATPRPT